jgi:hypothetical protein
VQWIELQGLVDELAILESIKISVQESHRPNISHVRHYIELIREKLLPEKESDSTILTAMR